MMSKYPAKWLFFLTAILLVFLQSTLLEKFKLFGVKPELLLIVVILAALRLKPQWSFSVAVFSGLLKDMMGPYSFGVNIVLFAALSLLIYKVSKQIPFENEWICFAALAVSAFLYELSMRMYYLALDVHIPWYITAKILIISPLYTAFALFLYYKSRDFLDARRRL